MQEYAEFQHQAYLEATALNDACEKEFRIGEWDHWTYDLDAATLTFSTRGVPQVVAQIQVVGSTSNRSKDWLWSWANDTIPEIASAELLRVKEFGAMEGIYRLTNAATPATEQTGWEFASVAAKILGAKGTFRCRGENGYLYLVYTDISYAYASPLVQ